MSMGMKTHPVAEARRGFRTGTGARGRPGKSRLRARSLNSLLTMGHCAPAVMKSLADLGGFDAEGPVRLAAGLPGGIGDSGGECGGLTSPLLFLGLRHGLAEGGDGLPLVVSRGHDHVRRFLGRNGTLFCREIRGENYRLRRCIKAVCLAPELALAADRGDVAEALSGESREAYARLYSHWGSRSFHCARSVMERLGPESAVDAAALDAASAYLGGTLFMGLTCGALTAGIMALGLRLREFERSLPRVLRMIILMKTGGDAFADRINRFNPIMNSGKRLAAWFAREFGDTQCRALTGCDFSSAAGVQEYIAANRAEFCLSLSERVAEKVRSLAVTES